MISERKYSPNAIAANTRNHLRFVRTLVAPPYYEDHDKNSEPLVSFYHVPSLSSTGLDAISLHCLGRTGLPARSASSKVNFSAQHIDPRKRRGDLFHLHVVLESQFTQSDLRLLNPLIRNAVLG
jgi:hypothetical protein